ncbi:hypothetical protein AKO1_008142 [Acrasis kona]|uniref:Eukaryotic translation initiation factor 4E n=1 Tax=Acrasis kona TaxID=1008807 RepID=A0AAW2YQZ8_9EUKA
MTYPMRASSRRQNSWISDLKLEIQNIPPEPGSSNTSTPTSSAPQSATHSRTVSMSARSWYDISEDGDDDEKYLEEAYLDLIENMDPSVLDNDIEEDVPPTPEVNVVKPIPGGYQVSEGEPLTHAWTVYYDEGVKKDDGSSLDYFDQMERLGTVETVVDFLNLWKKNDFDRPYHQLSINFNLRVFKKGVKPIWEDSQNANGGKFSIQTTDRDGKDLRPGCWRAIALSVVNGLILNNKEYDITGVVFSSRPRVDSIQIWNGCNLNSKRLRDITSHLRSVCLQHFKEVNVQYEAYRPVLSSSTAPMSRGRGFDKLSRRQPLSPMTTSPVTCVSGFSAPPSPISIKNTFTPITPGHTKRLFSEVLLGTTIKTEAEAEADNVQITNPLETHTPVKDAAKDVPTEDVKAKEENLDVYKEEKSEIIKVLEEVLDCAESVDIPVQVEVKSNEQTEQIEDSGELVKETVQAQEEPCSLVQSVETNIVEESNNPDPITTPTQSPVRSVKEKVTKLDKRQARTESFKLTASDVLSLPYDREVWIRFALVFLSAAMLKAVVYL